MDCHRTGNETLILLRDDKRESMDNKTIGKSASDVGRQPVKATILNVLIASPSDVSAERDVVESAIREWNANHRAQSGIMLHAVRWETHSYPATGERPQGIINRQIVDSGHLLIGIFGNRVGTPPAKHSPEPSRTRCLGSCNANRLAKAWRASQQG
jgi:hypothetical protein